jgi:hypothetical protein
MWIIGLRQYLNKLIGLDVISYYHKKDSVVISGGRLDEKSLYISENYQARRMFRTRKP